MLYTWKEVPVPVCQEGSAVNLSESEWIASGSQACQLGADVWILWKSEGPDNAAPLFF